jgi:GTP-binding protein
LMDGYLVDRESLRGVVVLVDCRVVTEQDRQTIAWLRSIRRTTLVVATKVDKLKPSERVRTLKHTHRDLGLAQGETLIPYSSVTGDGREWVWGALRDLIGGHHPEGL